MTDTTAGEIERVIRELAVPNPYYNGTPLEGMTTGSHRDARRDAVALIRALAARSAGTQSVDDLAQEIRRVDGANTLGAGALAEALWPFVAEVSA